MDCIAVTLSFFGGKLNLNTVVVEFLSEQEIAKQISTF